MVASVGGEIEGGALTNRRPFRAPHHSASMPTLVGGGLHARPGEISFAHHGVLFLDELPDPAAGARLAAPAARNRRGGNRARQSSRHLSGALHAGGGDEPCRCGLNARCTADYQARISGPLLDRIDLHIEVPAVTAADLILPPPTEGSRVHLAEALSYRALADEIRRAA